MGETEEEGWAGGDAIQAEDGREARGGKHRNSLAHPGPSWKAVPGRRESRFLPKAEGVLECSGPGERRKGSRALGRVGAEASRSTAL